MMNASEQREEIRHALEGHQREFRAAVAELKDAARSYANPRDPIRENPFRWMAIALVVGLFLGARR